MSKGCNRNRNINVKELRYIILWCKNPCIFFRTRNNLTISLWQNSMFLFVHSQMCKLLHILRYICHFLYLYSFFIIECVLIMLIQNYVINNMITLILNKLSHWSSWNPPSFCNWGKWLPLSHMLQKPWIDIFIGLVEKSLIWS